MTRDPHEFIHGRTTFLDLLYVAVPVGASAVAVALTHRFGVLASVAAAIGALVGGWLVGAFLLQKLALHLWRRGPGRWLRSQGASYFVTANLGRTRSESPDSGERKWVLHDPRDSGSITHYKCSLEAGQRVRLKKALVVRDTQGKPTGKIHPQGEVWIVLFGMTTDPVLWFRAPDGSHSTWDDEAVSVNEWFELANEGGAGELRTAPPGGALVPPRTIGLHTQSSAQARGDSRVQHEAPLGGQGQPHQATAKHHFNPTSGDLMYHAAVLLVGGAFIILSVGQAAPGMAPIVVGGGSFWILTGYLLKRRVRLAKLMAIAAMCSLGAWGLYSWVTLGYTFPRMGMTAAGAFMAWIYSTLDLAEKSRA